MARRYETRLAAEREGALRLKGENGIMRGKFAGLAGQVEEQRQRAAAAEAQTADAHKAAASPFFWLLHKALLYINQKDLLRIIVRTFSACHSLCQASCVLGLPPMSSLMARHLGPKRMTPSCMPSFLGCLFQAVFCGWSGDEGMHGY
jgi:hypothetical protein